MNNKYAILIDGGFLNRKLQTRLRHFPTAEDVVSECERLKALEALSSMSLLRIYYYHAPPLAEVITNPISGAQTDLSTSSAFRNNTSLLDKLELKPDFALRLGEVFSSGWKLGKNATRDITTNARPVEARDFIPDLNQKGVDLRIGLDIARLSLGHLVDVIVVVTGDSDFVPAFKFARREGIRVYLDHMGHGVRRELKAHVDRVL